MKNIWIIIKYTFREALAKKIMITFLILSALTVVGFGLAFSLMGDAAGIAGINVSNQTTAQSASETISAGVRFLEYGFVATLFVIGLFLSIFSTAGLVPDLLKKGNIDLFLSKPISKFELLSGKFLGGLAIVFVNIVFLVGSIWLMVGLKFSFWETSFLLSIFSITFVFATLYALMTLLAVLTKSPVLPTIISFLIVIVLNPLLTMRTMLYDLTDSSVVKGIFETFYYLIPQANEIVTISQDSILGKADIVYTPIYTTAALLIVYLSLSFFFFKKKDF